jgi:hypothetical protein
MRRSFLAGGGSPASFRFGQGWKVRRVLMPGAHPQISTISRAAIAGGVSLWQVQLITAREREARKALREQEREDTRDDFQRDAIIALHDAITAYWQTALVANEQIREWVIEAKETLDQAIWVPVRADYWRMSAARAKVFDDELRRLVKDVSLRIDGVVSADVQQHQGALGESYELLGQIEERVNALLKQLF